MATAMKMAAINADGGVNSDDYVFHNEQKFPVRYRSSVS